MSFFAVGTHRPFFMDPFSRDSKALRKGARRELRIDTTLLSEDSESRLNVSFCYQSEPMASPPAGVRAAHHTSRFMLGFNSRTLPSARPTTIAE